MLDRKTFIGGTDISCILGLNPWKTALKCWAEKIGQIEPEDLSDNEAVQLGVELEEFVAKKFEKSSGLKVRRPPVDHYFHEDYPMFGCQVDRLIEGTDDLLEVKTASLRKEKDWDGNEIPAHYICQVQWQLFVTGRKTGYIAVLIGGQKFVWKKIESDAEFQHIMKDKALVFWQMVKDGVAPSASIGDDGVLLQLHPKSDDQLQAVQEMETAIARRQELSMQIDQLKEEKELLEVKLKECIGDNLGIKTDLYVVTWKPQVSNSLDTEAIKRDGLYEKYLSKNETRVLRITKAKGA